jgi:hypothetical protein
MRQIVLLNNTLIPSSPLGKSGKSGKVAFEETQPHLIKNILLYI